MFVPKYLNGSAAALALSIDGGGVTSCAVDRDESIDCKREEDAPSLACPDDDDVFFDIILPVEKPTSSGSTNCTLNVLP
jgi:hypothetical protein